jgi:hypothetical protein
LKGLFVLIALGALLLIPTSNFAFAQVTDIYFSQEPSPSLDEVFSGTPGSNTVTQLTSGGFVRIDDVEIDPIAGKLWWNNWVVPGAGSPLEGIYSSNLDGTGQVQVTGAAESSGSNGFASGLHGIVLDPANQHIFFTRGVSYANPGEVSRVNMDGTGYTQLDAAQNDAWFVHGIELSGGTVYWGEPGVFPGIFGGAVNSMDTAGAGKATLVPWTSGQGRSIAVDSAKGLLFYSAFGSPGSGGEIYVLDLNNIPGGAILEVSDLATGIPDIELDTANMLIYWTDFARGEIRSASYDATGTIGPHTVEISGLTNPFGLALAFGQDVVAGEMLPIDNAALMLAGIQSISLMIPIVVTAAGIGFVLIRRKF